jgi:hypothetical protein
MTTSHTIDPWASTDHDPLSNTEHLTRTGNAFSHNDHGCDDHRTARRRARHRDAAGPPDGSARSAHAANASTTTAPNTADPEAQPAGAHTDPMRSPSPR